jgi:hypothetical protein
METWAAFCFARLHIVILADACTCAGVKFKKMIYIVHGRPHETYQGAYG